MIGKNRAYTLLIGLILFNLAIPIATAMGFSGEVTEHGIAVGGAKSIIDLYLNGLGNLSFWMNVAGVGIFAVITSKIGGIHITLSSLIFAGVFIATSSPLHGILGNMVSEGWISGAMQTFIVGIYALAFLIGLMELAR